MIRDYICSARKSDGIYSAVLESTPYKFPDVHFDCVAMAGLSLSVKTASGMDNCMLPFCHTVEAEALGADINYGDENNGPRVRDYVCSGIDDLLGLPDIDFEKGRIRTVLEACKLLREAGETAVLEVTGPFTVLNSLMDPSKIFRLIRKEPEKMQKVFEKLGKNIISYIIEAEKYGVNIISYADPTGGVSIIGPKLAENTAQSFMLPLFKELEKVTKPETLINLCPKTAFALLDSGCAMEEEMSIPTGISYGKACQTAAGRVKFTGMVCIKNSEFKMQSTLKYLKLK